MVALSFILGQNNGFASNFVKFDLLNCQKSMFILSKKPLATITFVFNSTKYDNSNHFVKGVKELNNINIQRLRLELGMSQAELADKVGVSRQTINMIETGKIQNPRKETIFAIAKVLMVDIDELYNKPT